MNGFREYNPWTKDRKTSKTVSRYTHSPLHCSEIRILFCLKGLGGVKGGLYWAVCEAVSIAGIGGGERNEDASRARVMVRVGRVESLRRKGMRWEGR